MTFTTNGYTLAPFYNDDTSPYHVYFHRSEPEIVFGSVDSGMANPQRSDGLSFLDAAWEQAPFGSNGQFRKAVAATAQEFVTAGLLTAAQRDQIVSAANRAELGH